MSPRDIALHGLTSGKSRDGLMIVKVRGKGLGVITTVPIPEGAFVTDYRYSRILTTKQQKEVAEAEHITNQLACYILEVFVKGKKLYLDASTKYNSYGR